MALDTARGMTAIVIGGGHNGLTAAATLAGQGARVTVLERAAEPGGMMVAGDGSGAAHLIWNLRPAALSALGTDAAALGLGAPLPTVALDPDGRHVVIEGDEARLAGGEPHPEAEPYRALRQRLRRFARVLAPLVLGPPPRLSEGWLTRSGLADLRGLGRLGLDLRRLGRADMQEFLRIVLSNVSDVLLEHLSDGPLAASLAFDGVLGARAGPRSPGTVLSLLYRHLQGGERQRPEGGMAALARRMAEAASARGVEIRCGTEVTGLTVEHDRVTGVRTATGETLAADIVLSSLGARPTLTLAGPEHFDAEVCRRIRNIRAEGTTAHLDITLAEPPRIPGLEEQLPGARLLFAQSILAMERAFNPIKYGQRPEAPMIEALVHRAENGGDRLSAVVQYVPREPVCGWSPAARKSLAETAIATIESYCPGFAGLVRETALLTPADIEARTGAPGGHWHHGEFAADQLLTVRPVNGMAQYRTGLPGLYLCGAGVHPGGDITGLPGRNAALVALSERVPA